MAMFDIKKHPAFLAVPAVIALMKPLLKCGITNFAVAVVRNNQSYLLSSSQAWLIRYFSQEYYKLGLFSNEDLRASKKEVFLVWDSLRGTEAFQAYYKDGYDHNLAHWFTITQPQGDEQYRFYFTAEPENKAINQLYCNRMHELLAFIAMFKAAVANDSMLTQAFSTKVLDLSSLDKDRNDHIKLPNRCVSENDVGIGPVKRYILDGIYANKQLSKRELQCLYWLQQGKTVPEIAALCYRSSRTIEDRVTNIKRKLQCENLFQLGGKVAELGLNDLLK